MTKTAIIVVSDLHVNSTVAICTPTIHKDDGQTEHASRTQLWLWRSWNDFIQQVNKEYSEYRRILVVNGDLGELDTAKRSIQLHSLNKATIQRMATDVLEPMLDIVSGVVVMRGTAAHTGKSAWLEEAIAHDLDGVVSYDDTIASHWHMRRVIEGVKCDICHHGSRSASPFTVGYGAIRAAAKMQMYYQRMRAPSPDIAIRSHNHQYETSGDNYETEVIFTPAWTTLTEYGYRVGYENSLSDIGGVVVTCEDGKKVSKKYLFEPKEARRVWSMTI